MRMTSASKPSKWLIIAAYGLISLALVLLAPLAGETEGKWPKPRVKNIILFIGDGMQLEHEIATSQYLTGKPLNLAWNNLLFHRAPCSTWDVTTYNRYAFLAGRPPFDPATFDPRLGYDPEQGGRWPFPFNVSGQDPYFLTMLPLPTSGPKYPATDSASAATAWATGFKTDDGNLAWLPGDPADGRLKTIAEEMRDKRGAAIGVVSTVPFSHATPAAHVSHNVNRNNYHAIADEIIKSLKPDVVIGGGHPLWATKLDASGANVGNYMSIALYNEVKSGAVPDYVFVERVAGANGGTALMNGARRAARENKKLFGLFGGTGGNFEPPLPQHSPGAPAVVRQTAENPLFDEAVIAALKVLSKDKDGFFAMFEQGDIDWANHADDFPWMVGTTWDLDRAVRAAMEFVRRPGDDVDWSNTMLVVTSDHANSYMRLVRDERGRPLLGKGMLPNGLPGAYDWVTYGSREHTNELVMLYVTGRGIGEIAKRQGAWYPGTRILDNTQLYEAMAEAAGIK